MHAARRCLIACVLALAGCAAPSGDLSVSVPPHIAATEPSALSLAPPRNVAVPAFAEASTDPGRIGARSSSGDPAGSVIIQPTPAQLLHEAFVAELRRAGHTIANTAEATIEAKVIGFSLRISPTAVDWQIFVNADIAVTARTDAMTVNHAYSTRCEDRSYATPGAGVIAGVVGHCIDDLARQFRSDTAIAHVLGAP